MMAKACFVIFIINFSKKVWVEPLLSFLWKYMDAGMSSQGSYFAVCVCVCDKSG